MGELTEAERLEVLKNLEQSAELREELALIEETQERLLMLASIKPRDAVKKQLFDKIDAQKPEAKVVAMKPDEGTNFWKLAVAASVSIAVVSSYLAYSYHDKWQSSKNDLSNLIAQNQRVAEDYNRVNQRLDKIETDVKIIDNPAFKRVIMNGTPNAPDAQAYVYWNEDTKEVYLSVQNMKDLAKENQYQLWAIIDGKPVDAGVFDGNLADGLLKMKAIGNGASLFAVTVEPRGGKSAPTLETMQVAGPVPAVKG